MKSSLFVILTVLLMTSCLSNSEVANANKKASYIVTERTASSNLPFSDAVIYDNIIYLSGKLGMTNENKLIEGGIGPETRQALIRIQQILEENGSSIDNIIKCTCMLADINEWEEMNKEYIKFFPNNKPARSAFGTSGLALGARIELECMAYLNDKQ